MRLCLALILTLFTTALARADDSFTQSLTPDDFQATGLAKLTPEERARLDALVRALQAGTLTRAKVEAAREVREQAKAEVKAEVVEQVKAEVREQVKAEYKAEVAKDSQKKASSGGFLSSFKVLLKPGTVIEYTTLDEAIVPPFNGWRKGSIFLLTNGQRWIVSDNDAYWAPTSNQPVRVHIVPGSMGSFFMEIDHGGRPRVKFLDNVKQAAPAK